MDNGLFPMLIVLKILIANVIGVLQKSFLINSCCLFSCIQHYCIFNNKLSEKQTTFWEKNPLPTDGVERGDIQIT